MDITSDGEELDATKGEPSGRVKASVGMIGEEKLPGHLVIVLRDSKLQEVSAQEVNEKAEVEFNDVTPGKYELLARGGERAYWVARISEEGTTSAGDGFDVRAGTSVAVAISVVGGSVNVEGSAKRNGKAAAGAMVVLVPKNPEANRDLFRRDQSDQDGSFSLLNVIPGTYTVCAIEDGWSLDWSTVAVITSYCQQGVSLVVEQRDGTVHLQAAVEVHAK